MSESESESCCRKSCGCGRKEKNIDYSLNGEEYIYNFDLAWDENNQECKVDLYSIVQNLKLENYKYTFNFKDAPEEKYHCSYGWAFSLNTSENLELFKKTRELRDDINNIQKEISEIYKKITLNYDAE